MSYIILSIFGLVAILVIGAITAIIVLAVKKKTRSKNLPAGQNSDPSMVAAKQNPKWKTTLIVVVSIALIFVIGGILYFTLNKEPDLSKYYGTYECQVQQGNAETTYRIVINEPQDYGGGAKFYSGSYSASSTNSSFSFNYFITYTISGSSISISFNQGNTLSGSFTADGNLIVNSIGEQRDLIFFKVV